MTPFVLLGGKKLPPESKPSQEEVYDDHRQLWVDRSSGIPLVLRVQRHGQASSYGETTMTETREGVDQTEGTATDVFEASPFGETTITKTREGADQTEGAAYLEASQYGETVHTRTREGVDQAESSALQGFRFGETTLTSAREGDDQTEGLVQMTVNAAHSHF